MKSLSDYLKKYIKRNNELFLLSVLIGFIVGIVTVPYRFLLVKSVYIRNILFDHDYPLYIHLLIILIMWVVGLLLYKLTVLFPYISGSGIPEVECFVTSRLTIKNNFKQLVSKFIAGVTGIGMGFSLGREGPSVEIGGYIANMVSKAYKINKPNQRYLVSSGAAAGLSSAFSAPLASAIFVNEELTKYQSPRISLTTLIASIISGWCAKLIFLNDEYLKIDATSPVGTEYYKLIPILLILALLLSIIAKIFNYLILRFQSLYQELKIPAAFKILSIIITTYAIGYIVPDLLAGGEPVIFNNAKSGGNIWIILLLLVVKLIYTPICYAVGFPGGIFLPLLVIGGLAGKFFLLALCEAGLPLEQYSGFFILISMGAIFAAVVRSPITGTILILEMTGVFSIFFPMIVLVGLTYLISGIIQVQPIYDLLCKRILPPDLQESTARMLVEYCVHEDSYCVGRKVSDIILPKDCDIVKVLRGKNFITDENLVLQISDVLIIDIYSRDLEKLHRSFRSLCME